MGKITKVKCATDEEWRIKRNEDIGGSDAAVVLGISPYKSAYALWCEMTKKIPVPDISDKEAVRLGNDLEDYVAKRWCEMTGKKVHQDKHLIYNSDYPFAHASIDRKVTGENAGLECKTTSSWDIIKDVKDGIIPDCWVAQCVHYMMITGYEKWYLAVLAFGVDVFEFTIDRNDKDIEIVANAERAFFELVKKDIAPPIDGTPSSSQAVKTMFGESLPGSSVDMRGMADKINAYLSLEKQIKTLEVMQEGYANVLKDYMGVSEKGTCGDNISVSWKTSTRRTFDKALFEERNGKIPEEFYKSSSCRTFRITEKKQK